MTNISTRSANRYMFKLIRHARAHELELAHPEKTESVQRIFQSPAYRPEVHTLSSKRKQELIRAAKNVAQTVPGSIGSTSVEARLEKIEKRLTSLEKSKTNIRADIRRVKNTKIEPLEFMVENLDGNIQHLQMLNQVTEENFERAEKIILRDERMLKKLRTDVKTSMAPQVRLHERQLKKISEQVQRLETMYKIFSNIESYDEQKVKTIGERLELTKQLIKKLKE